MNATSWLQRNTKIERKGRNSITLGTVQTLLVHGVNKWFQDESKDFTENSEYIKRKEKYNRFSPGHLQKYGTEYDSCAYNSWRTWNSTKDMKSKLDEL